MGYNSLNMPENQPLERTLKTKNEIERDLVTWIGPSRPFKKRNKEFYITVIAMAAVVGFILFLVDGWLPVVLLISLIFLFYVMSTVPPEDIEYKITNKGIKVAGRRTEWQAMGRFWFTKRFDNDLLVVETYAIPGRLELVVNQEKKEEIQNKISEFLTHEEVSPSFIDKASNWFSKRIPQ